METRTRDQLESDYAFYDQPRDIFQAYKKANNPNANTSFVKEVAVHKSNESDVWASKIDNTNKFRKVKPWFTK